jgi:hypothetical protein
MVSAILREPPPQYVVPGMHLQILAIPDSILTAAVDILLARRGFTIELLDTIVPELSVHGTERPKPMTFGEGVREGSRVRNMLKVVDLGYTL